MLLGDILVAKGLVSKEDIERAVERQRESGGRFGESLIALEIITAEQIEEVLSEWPKPPGTFKDLDVDPMLILQLMIKGMHAESMETASQLSEAMKLPNPLINAFLTEAANRKLTEAIGQAESAGGAVAEMRLGLSRAGRDWAVEALEQEEATTKPVVIWEEEQ